MEISFKFQPTTFQPQKKIFSPQMTLILTYRSADIDSEVNKKEKSFLTGCVWHSFPIKANRNFKFRKLALLREWLFLFLFAWNWTTAFLFNLLWIYLVDLSRTDTIIFIILPHDVTLPPLLCMRQLPCYSLKLITRRRYQRDKTGAIKVLQLVTF